MTHAFTNKELKNAAGVLRAILHPLRQRMLKYILKNQPVRVTKIYKALELRQSDASRHLRILRDAGFVQARRDGKQRLYSIDAGRIEQVLLTIREFLKH